MQHLEHSQYQLSLIYNSAIDPMWLISVEGHGQFRFENINDVYTLVTGLKREQVIGLLIEEALPPTSHQLVRNKYNEAISTGRVIDYVEVAVHPAGEKVGEIRVIPVKDKNGIITKLVGIANDITEKRALQKGSTWNVNEYKNRLRQRSSKARNLSAIPSAGNYTIM